MMMGIIKEFGGIIKGVVLTHFGLEIRNSCSFSFFFLM
jgi:hypothetical protein